MGAECSPPPLVEITNEITIRETTTNVSTSLTPSSSARRTIVHLKAEKRISEEVAIGQARINLPLTLGGSDKAAHNRVPLVMA